ncbi:MAG: hypothetical protein ABIM88_05425 [candidate division WOR-3 bacterium]
MKKVLWIIGLSLGFVEGVFLLLFVLDTWSDPLGMAVHSLPALLVLVPTVLGIWFRKTSGIILFLEGIGLACLWLIRAPNVSWAIYLLIPGGIIASGVFLFMSGIRRAPVGRS